jgi:hypothetical protein
LSRHLGVHSRTAWRLKHKIMQAMTMRETARQLTGFVQIDDISPLFGTRIWAANATAARPAAVRRTSGRS